MSKIIENYRLLEEIGQGEFGKVFKATHLTNSTTFAIKQVLT